MKITLSFALAAAALPASAAPLVIDNKDHSGIVTAGSQSTFEYQSFTPNTGSTLDGDAANSDNIADNLPLPATVFLQNVTFVKAPSGAGTAGSLFLDVFAYNTTTNVYASYVGSSLFGVDVNAAAALTDMIWSFDNLALSSTTEYALVFSADGDNGINSTAFQGVDGRVAAANIGGGFVNTLNNGEAANPPAAPVAFDTRVEIAMDTVPEPGAALLLLGGAGLLAGVQRRRRQRTP